MTRRSIRLPLQREDASTRPIFTGERFVPGQAGARIAYEHLHRYLFARRLVEGARVLDLGCGLGYGSELLCPPARSLVALDIDPDETRMARALRTRPTPFVVGDAACLPFANASFDVVVAFEMIEHLVAQEALVAEVRRVLTPGGRFIVSSPDTTAYAATRTEANPFHVRELTTDGFVDLLAAHFGHVALYRQRVVSGSLLLAADGTGPPDIQPVQLHDDPPALVLDPDDAAWVYNVAVCAAAPSGVGPGTSMLADVGEQLTRELEESNRAINQVRAGLEQSVAEWQRYAEQMGREKDAHLEHVMAAQHAHTRKSFARRTSASPSSTPRGGAARRT